MHDPEPRSKWRKFAVVLILFIINLLNYADRFTIAGVLTDIQKYYDITDGSAGFIQTIFIISFMLFSPLFGFLGDRYTRKWIMVVGIIIWVAAVFVSTFIPRNFFWLFLVVRGVVGIGEASYAVVTPTLIGDMYIGKTRSMMLTLFYMAIPIGSGIGYVVGTQLAEAWGEWQWGMRLTPIIGLASVLLIVLFVFEPERGLNESNQQQKEVEIENVSCGENMKSYLFDLLTLLKNLTYVFSTIGYTAIVFVAGTLSWWIPTAINHARAWELQLNTTDELPAKEKENIALYFGVVTILGGLIGVALGSFLSWMLRNGRFCLKWCKTNRSDPIICAVGALVATPFLLAGLQLMATSIQASYACMFMAITGLCFNWAITVDLQMSIITPWRRNSANAWTILISHLFGDAAGPYLIGAVSDAIRESNRPEARYHSLLDAFYVTILVCIISVIFFAIAALTVLRDQARFQHEMGITVTKSADRTSAEVANNNIELTKQKGDSELTGSKSKDYC